ARLETAIAEVRRSIDRLIEESDHAGPGEHRDVLEAFRLVANDRGWLRRLREAVAGGLTAEAAVERVQNDARARLLRQTDPYLRERLHDLEDLATRVMLQLAGRSAARASADLPDNAVLVARSMGPAAILDYDRARLRGLALEDGGMTSHVAIVARALGIPVVGDVANVVALAEDGDAIIVDGGGGEVFLRPPPDIEAAYGEKARLRARRLEQYRGLRDVAPVTRDGVEVTLHMNAGLVVDMAHLEESGAASVGLFRTELQFMLAQRFPRVEAQRALYSSALAAAGGRAVTFRTLDIGGDKVLPYMPRVEEANPALGWRAIRMGLDRPALLRSQVRAMFQASDGRPLRVMFPMVATVAEFDAARALAEREMALLGRFGRPAPPVAYGAMVEIPALLAELDELLERADFLSVGSNDLVQYLFAADRDNKRVGRRYDALSRPALRALREIARAGARAGKPVTLCGEMGGRPLEAMALAAVGYRNLSMAPASIGPVKAMLLSLDLAAAAALAAELLDGPGGPHDLRAPLGAFAADAGVAV
ncbi:MAG: phosphoenolpyruvate--protein phosphotransferase, partial [Hyphomicrobiales bacterium]|nr:phosphoenolpyruvate--protein phosphotransferase [Hyphomicrobiales bacterium]